MREGGMPVRHRPSTWALPVLSPETRRPGDALRAEDPGGIRPRLPPARRADRGHTRGDLGDKPGAASQAAAQLKPASPPGNGQALPASRKLRPCRPPRIIRIMPTFKFHQNSQSQWSQDQQAPRLARIHRQTQPKAHQGALSGSVASGQHRLSAQESSCRGSRAGSGRGGARARPGVR